MGLSRHALRQASQIDAIVEAEQESWLTTEMVWLLLLHLQRSRRRVAARQKAQGFLLASMEACVPASFFDGVSPLEVSEENLAKCSKDVLFGECSCVRTMVASAPSRDNLHENLAAVLGHLHSNDDCSAIRAHLAELLVQMSRAALESVSKWATLDWHRGQKAMLHGLTRTRRVDAHVRQFVLHQSKQDGLTTTVGQAMKSLGSLGTSNAPKWREQDLGQAKLGRTLVLITW